MIHRDLLQVIENQLFSGKAIVLIGARQVGKTTLLTTLVQNQNIALRMLNCDEPETRNLLTDANLSRLALLLGDAKMLIIDEAQKVDNIGLTLKLLVDNFKDVQVIASGSSAFELRNRLNEPLTGRKWEYCLYPISSNELIQTFGLVEEQKLLENRLIYGSYPEIINHPEHAKQTLNELTQSYLYKDILSLGNIRKPQVVEKLLQALAFQVGSEVSVNELSRLLQVDNKTIDSYIDLLEKCYVIFQLSGLNRNLRSELKKSRKIYFYDNGVRNAVIQQFAPLQLRNDTGALWENFFISERMKRNHYRGHFCKSFFWRTTQQQEIDLIEECDGKMTAFEMKWSTTSKARFPKTFLEAYDVENSIIITPDNYLDWVL